MELFWKATAAVLITCVLSLTLGKQGKDYSVLLVMAACCMAGLLALRYLESVLEFLRELEELCRFQEGMLSTLLKVIGIALVSEIAGLLCSDAGSGSLGKTMQLMGSTVILYLSIPLFRSLLTLVREILGSL